MEDSGDNEVKTPTETVELVRHMGTDKLTKRVRGEGGKFKKQKTTMPKTLDVTRLLRNLLLQSVAGPDGKMRKGDKTRIRAMFDNIFEIASMSPEQPVFDKFGNPIVDENGKAVTAKDAKIAMASVQAFKELMSRAYGMPSKSDEEMDALKTQGVKIVVIAPPNMMDKEVYEEKPKEKLVPAFIDAEIVTKS